MSMTMNRRQFGIGLGAATGLGLSGIRPASAAGQVIVGTWGGDYQNLLDQNIAQPILKPMGIEVVYDTGNDVPRKTKLLAERRLPRGSIDIAALTASGAYEMYKAGALQELDTKKLANIGHMLPKLKTPYSVPHIYTGRVILYNPDKVKTKPTSYADLWKPEYAGKVGVIDIQYQTTIESAALVNGGSMSDYEPGKAKLLELKKQGVKIYPTNEAMAQALKNEEVWICIMWKARGVMWQNAGIPVEIADPKEGIVLYISEMVMAKNAKNKDNAYAYLNALMDTVPQFQFARAMGYNPTVDNVTLPKEISERINFPADVQAKFMLQDQEYLAKNDAQLREWWDKVFKA